MKKILMLLLVYLMCLSVAFLLAFRAEQVNKQMAQNNTYESEK